MHVYMVAGLLLTERNWKLIVQTSKAFTVAYGVNMIAAIQP